MSGKTPEPNDPPRPHLTGRKHGMHPGVAAAIGGVVGALICGFLFEGLGLAFGIVLGGGIAFMLARW